MIVIISPSKTFSDKIKIGNSDIVFKKEVEELFQSLQKLSVNEIEYIFKVSNQLANLIYGYYNNEKKLVRAIDLYEGVAFKELKKDDLEIPNDKLLILSALYGVLRPEDNIFKYRLDFNVKYFGNLAEYWKDKVKDYINDKYRDEILINLSSKEFHHLIIGVNNLYDIDFVNINDSNKRISSVLLKQLRGGLSHVIIKNKINTIDEIKDIKILGFEYNNILSKANNIVFTNIKK